MQAQWDPLISGIEFVQRGPVTPAVKTRTGSSCFLESSPLGMHSICCHVTGPGKEIDPSHLYIPFPYPPVLFLSPCKPELQDDVLPRSSPFPHSTPCTSSSIRKHLFQEYISSLASSGGLVP